MLQETIAQASTIELAKEAAMRELKLTDEDDFDIEVLEYPKPKVLGMFGGSLAKVRIFREIEEPKRKPKAKKPAKKETKKAEPKKMDDHIEIDHPQVNAAVEYLKKVISGMNVENLEIAPVKTQDGIVVEIDGDDLGIVIGRKGETVDALQHLASLVANRAGDEYLRITLNPKGYREQRKETLCAIANRTAEKALDMGKSVALEPMNSYERRIIHNAIGELDNVISWSIGEGDNRRVVIGQSKDDKIFFNDKRRNQGARQRNGGRRRDRKPSQTVNVEPKREPKKDASIASLYGKID